MSDDQHEIGAGCGCGWHPSCVIDGELAARQILRAYIDDERLVRKAFNELFGENGVAHPSGSAE